MKILALFLSTFDLRDSQYQTDGVNNYLQIFKEVNLIFMDKNNKAKINIETSFSRVRLTQKCQNSMNLLQLSLFTYN